MLFVFISNCGNLNSMIKTLFLNLLLLLLCTKCHSGRHPLKYGSLTRKISIATEKLKHNLLARYAVALHECSKVTEKKKQVVKWVYAGSERFKPEAYLNGKLPAGGVLADTRDEHTEYTYGLDSHGRPCYVLYESRPGEPVFTGFYNFSDSCVEMIAFNTKEEPVQLSRVLLADGKKTAYQHININGNSLAPAYKNFTPQQLVQTLAEGRYDVLLHVQQFQYNGSRIVSADCASKYPGWDRGNYQYTYNYNEAGELEDITGVKEDGSTEYAYVKLPAGKTIEQVSDQLALEMAQAIATAVAKQNYTSPPAIIELNYHEVDVYEPVIHVLTAAQKEKIIRTAGEKYTRLFLTPFIDEVAYGLEHARLYAAFMNAIEEQDEWWVAANAMIRKVAKLLTTQKLWNKAPVDKEFIVYCVDWTMTPDKEEFCKLLLECGLPEVTLQKWEKEGYFD